MSKRLAILVCYCPLCDIAPYKRKIIETIKEYVTHLVVVSNGKIKSDDYEWLENHSSEIIIRENIGFDAGAYKDALYGRDLSEYDELLLINDTFYGFFYPLEEFFLRVEENTEVDFWSITKHPMGNSEMLGDFPEHYQSYFLLIRDRMFQSAAFVTFWRELVYPTTYYEAVRKFEIRFSEYFKAQGFYGKAYCDLPSIGIPERYNENPTVLYCDKLISDLRAPILKKKMLAVLCPATWDAIAFIRDHLSYDTDIIMEQMFLDYKSGVIREYFNLYDMEQFIKKYSKINIYGYGNYAQCITRYLAFRGRKVDRYIVSHRECGQGEEVVEFSQVVPDREIGIIVALKAIFTQEVLESLLEKFERSQLFLGTPQRENGET